MTAVSRCDATDDASFRFIWGRESVEGRQTAKIAGGRGSENGRKQGFATDGGVRGAIREFAGANLKRGKGLKTGDFECV